MFRTGVRLSLILLIFISVMLSAATLIGGLFETDAITTVLMNERDGGTDGRILLFDLNRNLRIDYRIPLPNIWTMQVDYESNHRIAVTTRRDDFRARVFKRELHFHNLYTGETTTVHSISSDNLNISTFGYQHTTNQESKTAFFETSDASLYVFDFETGERKVLTMLDRDNSVGSEYISMSWSPDDTQLAINPRLNRDNQLMIFDVDSGEQRSYPVEVTEYYPQWTEDGQYIMLYGYEQGSNMPIHILRADDGTEHPFTEGLSSLGANGYGCNLRWLTYVFVNKGFQEGYILDMQTGEQVRVNDHPMLAEQEIQSITPTNDCQHFMITGRNAPSNRLNPQMNPLYLFDFSSVHKIAESARIVQYSEDGKSIFYQQNDVPMGPITLYQRLIVPFSDPVKLGEYEVIDTVTQLSEDFSFITFEEDGRLAVKDLASGETRYLTDDQERIFFFHSQYRWIAAKLNS